MATARQIDEAIETYGIDPETGEELDGFDYYETGWHAVEAETDNMVIEVDGETLPVKVVSIYTTSAEELESYIIVKVGDKTYRKDGWYASHDGSYWDGSFYEAHEVEKTIKVWERI